MLEDQHVQGFYISRSMYKTRHLYVHNMVLLNIVTFVHKPSTDNLQEVMNIRTKNVEIRI